MIRNLLLLNGLKPVDIGFFIGCAVVIVLIVAVYFLIPVFNKKQYAEQRENLRKREDAFKSNKQTTVALEETAEENSVVDEQTPVTDSPSDEENAVVDETVSNTVSNTVDETVRGNAQGISDVSVDTNGDEER